MAGAVTTSLVVQFGSLTDSSSYYLSAEIDSRPTGKNKGVTSFLPGDSPYYIVYKSAALSLAITQSTGSSSAKGYEDIDQEEYIIFANENKKSLGKTPQGTVTLKYLAGVAGATVKGTDVVLPSSGVGVYIATYKARGYLYQMTGIPTTLEGETSFPVVAVIVGTAA